MLTETGYEIWRDGLDFDNVVALGELKKAIRTDHALARELWATGNWDARHLAFLVADPTAAPDGRVRQSENFPGPGRSACPDTF